MKGINLRDPAGPRRPWLLRAGLVLAGAFALIFAAPDLDSRWLEAGWVLVFFVLAASAYAFFQVPYVAMPAEITDSYDERDHEGHEGPDLGRLGPRRLGVREDGVGDLVEEGDLLGGEVRFRAVGARGARVRGRFLHRAVVAAGGEQPAAADERDAFAGPQVERDAASVASGRGSLLAGRLRLLDRFPGLFFVQARTWASKVSRAACPARTLESLPSCSS